MFMGSRRLRRVEAPTEGRCLYLSFVSLYRHDKVQPMRKPLLMLPSPRPASTSLLDRRGFLIGAGAAGMALGGADWRRLYAGRQCAGYHASNRTAAPGARARQGDRHVRLQRHGAGSGAAPARGSPGPPSTSATTPTSTTSFTGTASMCRRMPTARWRKDRRWCRPARRGAIRSCRGRPGRAGITATTWPMKDLTRSLYSGMYGFLIVEPANDPGRYDQEVLLAAHHWEGPGSASRISARDRRPTTASK